MLICPHSGIGNQIGNYVFAQYLLSLGIDLKFLYLKDETIDRTFVLDKFHTELPEAAKEDIEKFLKAHAGISLYSILFKNLLFRKKAYFNSLYKILQRIRLKYNIYPLKTPAFMAKIVSYEDILKAISNGKKIQNEVAVCDCYSPIQEFSNPEFKRKMREHFILKEELDEKNLEILNKIKTYRNSVGIHIRRGDYIGLKIPVVKKEFLLDKISFFTEKFGNKNNAQNENLKFFIFSDSMDWAKKNLSDTGFDVEFVDINDEAHGYIDFVLFNACRHRIYSASSFSNWVRYLNPYKDSVEFFPENKDLVVE